MSSFGGIYSVRSGLDAARRALDVVGQNVSNANTNGYTRQEVSFVSADPTKIIRSAGRGIGEVQVLRYRDEFLDRQFRNRAGLQGFYDALSTQMGQVEQVMGDLSDTGLRNSLDQFFNSWDTLASHPTDSSARAQVVSSAQDFINMAQEMYSQLQTLRTNADEAIQANVKDMNNAAQQLADLNQEIMRQELGGKQTANDLRDQRDRLLDSLSKLAGTTSVLNDDGTATVYLGALPIVDKQFAYGIGTPTLDTTGISSMQQLPPAPTNLVWNGTNTQAAVSGSIAGLMAVRDKLAPDYGSYIDTLVRTVATEVNAVHMAVDKNGNLPPQTPIFTGADGASPITAAPMDIAVNLSVIKDPSLITAAGTMPVPPATTVAASDGERALAIARLRDKAMVTGAPVGAALLTAGDYLRAVSTQLGIAVQQAQSQSDASSLQVSQADKQRQSVSGVSLDDEMTKMIQFQQAYNAAARMMTTMDEMLDTMVNRVGTVGR